MFRQHAYTTLQFIHKYYMPISHEVKEKFLDVSTTTKKSCVFILKVIAKYTERNIGVEICILREQFSFIQENYFTWSLCHILMFTVNMITLEIKF